LTTDLLTDYHTHLRRDELSATADEFFTPENVARYIETAADRGISELGFSEHVYRFREALSIWRHPFWEENATDDIDLYCDFVEEMKATGHRIKLGIEVDYLRGREEQIAALLDGRPWDYVIGSVHFIGQEAVDHDGYDAWRSRRPDQVWSEYFEIVGEAARSGLFDVLAHPDLVKVWGAARPAPSRDPRTFYELALDGIADSDVAVEVSTAGLRKPAHEMYPSPELLEMCIEAGRPVALSSDAHEPQHLGYEYDAAIDFLRDAGVSQLSVFERRQRTMEPMG
jgi:histidinol-phosphatase (PHP family)